MRRFLLEVAGHLGLVADRQIVVKGRELGPLKLKDGSEVLQYETGEGRSKLATKFVPESFVYVHKHAKDCFSTRSFRSGS